MNTKNALSVLVVSALLGNAVVDSHAESGPQYRSLRGLAMGNAFVAVVDDKDALYYNPAGLNLINALGNASARPSLAAYPRKRFQARVNVGMPVPYGDGMDMWRFYKDNEDAFGSEEALRQVDNSFFEELSRFDRKAIKVGLEQGAEFAMHNYGAAYWFDTQIAPYPDVGIMLPQAGVEEIRVDAVVQLAAARGLLNNRLAVGGGYRIANRREVKRFQLAAEDFRNEDDPDDILNSPAGEAIQDSLNEKLDGLSDIGSYGHGVDLGALWQQTPWLRLGASAQNLGMYLNSEFVTPEITVGAAVTPPVLSTGGMFARKVNLALDFEDIFNNERNYRLFGKINFGAEVEQQLWWIASMRVAGGFKGGYWSAGGGLSLLTALHLEYATWGEEAGQYTGHIEDRYHAVRIGVGI